MSKQLKRVPHGLGCSGKLAMKGNQSPMISNGRLRWKLLIGLLAAVLLDTLLQIIWKEAVLEGSADASSIGVIGEFVTNPSLFVIVAIMALQFCNWLMVLGQADLSYAKPVASLSYACVPVLSVLMLNEAFDDIEIAGIVFVIAGVWFIGLTNPLTEDTTKHP